MSINNYWCKVEHIRRLESRDKSKGWQRQPTFVFLCLVFICDLTFLGEMHQIEETSLGKKILIRTKYVRGIWSRKCESWFDYCIYKHKNGAYLQASSLDSLVSLSLKPYSPEPHCITIKKYHIWKK